MLDIKTENLLGILKRICPAGGYSVVSVDELMPDTGASAEEVASMLSRLSAEGFISLRFSEGDEYCLTVLEKGREHEAKFQEVPYIAQKRDYIKYIIAAAAAFFGAFLGGLTAGLF